MLLLPSKAEELLRMNESIHGERTASELQDRVTELASNRRPSRKCCTPLRTRRTTCSPSSTPSSTAPPVSVAQTYAAYVSPKKAAFVAWRYEETPFWLARLGHIPSARRKREPSESNSHKQVTHPHPRLRSS